MDIQVHPAVQVDLAMDKDANLEIGVSTPDDFSPQAAVQSNVQQEAITRVDVPLEEVRL